MNQIGYFHSCIISSPLCDECGYVGCYCTLKLSTKGNKIYSNCPKCGKVVHLQTVTTTKAKKEAPKGWCEKCNNWDKFCQHH